MRLVDTHVHLHAYPDYAGLLRRASLADVSQVVAIGINATTSRWNIETARHHHEVVAVEAIAERSTYLWQRLIGRA